MSPQRWLPRGAEKSDVSVRATPYRNLRAVVCVGRLPDPTTVFAGPALLANVRNQSEHEALAARCLATWPPLIREGGGEGKRSQSRGGWGMRQSLLLSRPGWFRGAANRASRRRR